MGLISEFKDAIETLQKMGQVDLYQKLSPFMDEIIELKDQNNDLKEENTKLKKHLEIKDSLFFEDNLYYSVDADGNKKDGPFCSSCWDNNNKLVRPHQSGYKKGTYFRCPVCGTHGGKK